jgi:DNA-binding XRE family transcriptional regulator
MLMARMQPFDLRRARVNQGLSKAALARKVGIDRRVIIALEKGKSVHPANAKLVADYFGCETADLLPPKEAA